MFWCFLVFCVWFVLFCFVFLLEDIWLFAFTYSPTCGNGQSKTKRFDDRQSLERARHELKKNPLSMMLFANLPFWPKDQVGPSANPDLRQSLNQYRLTKQDAPRIRIRSLEVIPLSLSLPRSAPLSDITHAIIQQSSLDDWHQQVLSPFSIRLMDLLIAFYSRPEPQLTKRLPPLLTWNPSSLATIHQQPSPKS